MAKLSTSKRKALKKSQFALPGKRTKDNPAGRGAYPIPDLAHARNALARVAQNGTPAEQAAVRAAVYRKFPALRKS
jgi:hypothetical protein